MENRNMALFPPTVQTIQSFNPNTYSIGSCKLSHPDMKKNAYHCQYKNKITMWRKECRTPNISLSCSSRFKFCISGNKIWAQNFNFKLTKTSCPRNTIEHSLIAFIPPDVRWLKAAVWHLCDTYVNSKHTISHIWNMASFVGLAFMPFLLEFLWQKMTIAIAHQRIILKVPKPSNGHKFWPRIILTSISWPSPFKRKGV